MVLTGFITAGIGVVEDAYVRDHQNQRDHGGESLLKARRKRSQSEYESYLKFDLSGHSIASTRLRLFITSAAAGSEVEIYLVSNDWSEHDLTWDDRPDLPPQPIATPGDVQAGWVELDLASSLAGQATVSLVIVASGDNDKVDFSSREGSSPPLILPDP